MTPEIPVHKSKPNILVAHFRSDIVSGAERSIADLVDHIQDRFSIKMLVPKPGSLAEYYRQRGFEVWVREVQNYRRRYPGLHFIQSYFFAKAVKKHQIQTVLCNTFSAASRVGTACRYAGIPYAVYIREYIADTPLNRKILAQANQVFVISKDLKNHIEQMTASDHVRLTYNHINPQSILARANAHRSSGKHLLPFSAQHPVVGLVGRIAPFKQQDLFVKAVPHILQAVPQARFVIVGTAQGKDHSYENQVQELAKNLGLQDKLLFLGQRTDNIELMTEMTVTCLTSTREPLGRVILEGFLLGVPVVATNAGGSDEIVEDGVDGLKFSATAPDACQQLASHIIRLLNNPDLRESLSSRAREKVTATFASDRFVQTQANYIQDLIDSNDSPW